NGLLYGVAANGYPYVQCPEIGSFIFSLSLSGEFKRYEDFGGCPHGDDVPPVVTGLMEASDGNLYGAAQETGGFGQNGVIFQMSLDGSQFHPILDMTLASGLEPGGFEGAGLIQGSDGALYGTARNGGTYQSGTVFRIDMGLTPPLPVVSYLSPASAAPDSSVIIAGQHLLGTTAVSFNGVAATTVTSRGPNYVLAVVPPGATSGPVTVTTPNGTVASKSNFTVQ
ncbi:MAG: choice-of-anchor tandem repeat GloVer-containing protein, partial [Bryobacteraceae bacterium]